MCTMIAHQVKMRGRAKRGAEWFEVREANVSYDHPYDLPMEHALNIDFVNEALGPGARVAVELSVDAARQLVRTIEAVLAQADQRGVLEDRPLAAAPASDPVVRENTDRAIIKWLEDNFGGSTREVKGVRKRKWQWVIRCRDAWRGRI